MQELTTPVISKVQVLGNYITLQANMELAGVAIVVEGSYNVGLNAFNPTTVMYEGQVLDLEEFCEKMNWDEYETTLAIQDAVENR